jgi:hypothetical protein
MSQSRPFHVASLRSAQRLGQSAAFFASVRGRYHHSLRSPSNMESTLSKSHNDILRSWNQQYHLPREVEGDYRTQKDKVHLYRPPRSDWPGILVACAVIGVWTALFIHALWFVKLPWTTTANPTSWPHIIAVFFSLEFLYTGLFITTHDAMHGTIALRNRRLNGEQIKTAVGLKLSQDIDWKI